MGEKRAAARAQRLGAQEMQAESFTHDECASVCARIDEYNGLFGVALTLLAKVNGSYRLYARILRMADANPARLPPDHCPSERGDELGRAGRTRRGWRRNVR
ncbi:MAG: hypothetical protein PCALPYG88_6913 [uncultured Paraburkholderia sp.]|nr:MAG: hypothetical protein PCALPYG08_7100 [uncultured Paraburkholderia sp.]CAH2941173.1 MAG: hypothetical protein PCALPYG88_6913 [uncultured Paraburkholderia sp.]